MIRRAAFIFLSFITLTSCYKSDGEPLPGPDVVGPATKGDHIALGNPSNATSSILQNNNYLMEKDQYVLSYNDSKRTANWVSWHLSKSWVGSVSRQDDFRADVALPSSWVSVGTYDYSGSGFDRGHMCPSADRTATIADNSSTFLMTNMIPQAPKNNQIPWANFESYCRSLVSSGHEVYIVAGPWGRGGSGSKGYAETIGNKSVVVPQYTWKVALVLLSGENDISRITKETRIIGIWMPNTQDASSKSWYDYRVSVDFIESKTGFDFYSSIPKEIQDVIEARVDTESI